MLVRCWKCPLSPSRYTVTTIYNGWLCVAISVTLTPTVIGRLCGGEKGVRLWPSLSCAPFSFSIQRFMTPKRWTNKCNTMTDTVWKNMPFIPTFKQCCASSVLSHLPLSALLSLRPWVWPFRTTRKHINTTCCKNRYRATINGPLVRQNQGCWEAECHFWRFHRLND